MNEPLPQNWQNISQAHQKQYKQFLKRADKNAALKTVAATA